MTIELRCTAAVARQAELKHHVPLGLRHAGAAITPEACSSSVRQDKGHANRSVCMNAIHGLVAAPR